MKQVSCTLAFLLITLYCMCQLPDSSVNPDQIPPEPPSTKDDSEVHPYRVNYWVEGSILIAGNVGNVLAINRIKNKPVISQEEIEARNTDPINEFDRWALNRDPDKRDKWDRISDNFLTPMIFLPGLLAFNDNIRHDGLRLIVMYAAAHAEVATIYNYTWMGPTFQNKFRPIVYYDSIPISVRESGNNRNSFYSGHVATAALSTFMMVKVYSDYHPDIGAKKFLLYAVATLPPLLISYIRVQALKHFPSDNIVGLGVGAVCGIVIPELHKKKNPRSSLTMFTSQDGGIGLTLNWNPERSPASK